MMTAAAPSAINAPRLPDWQARLDRLLRRSTAARFVWGLHDCTTFAGDVVEALTGVNPAGHLRGSYSGPVQALRLVRGCGHRSLREAVAATLGPPCDRSTIRRGDLVLLPVPPGESGIAGMPSWSKGLGVHLGGSCAMPRRPSGLRILYGDAIILGWRI